MNRRRAWLPVALMLVGLAGAALAVTAPTPAPWPIAPSPTAWFRVSLLGNPAGYLCSGTKLIHGDNNEELLEESETLALTFSLQGQSLKITANTATRYQRDLSPVEVRAHIDKLGVPVDAECRRVGDNLVMSYTEGAQHRDQTVPVPAGWSGELPVFLAISKGEIKPGESRTVTVYDPEMGALDQVTITAGAAGESQTFTVGGQPVVATPVHEHSQGLGADTTMWLDPTGEVIRYEMPTLMNLVAEEVTEQEALASLAPMVLVDSVPLAGTLPDSRTLTGLTLLATSPTQSVTDLIPTTRRQQVTAAAGGAQVAIQAQTPPAHTLPLPLNPKGFELYLASTTLAPCVDPQLMDRARQIVGTETDSYRAALLISHWVYQHMTMVASQPSPIDALEILHEMRGDCSEHALLTAALVRVVGIPSRVVTGLAMLPGGAYYHAWVEVYVGEWVEIDPTWNEDLVDAGHLRLADSALDSVSFSRMNLDTGRTLGALSLKVLDYQAPGH